MKNKLPIQAYDTQLQEKIDYLTQHPDKYFLEYEIERQVHDMECRRREIRAMEREIERSEITIAALRKALAILGNPEAADKPHEAEPFEKV